MINFYSENDFELQEEKSFDTWIRKVISSEEKQLGEINYIFCDDHYLYKINLKFLDHDTYTDIISFDNSEGDELNGDIFISIDRVTENAKEYNVDFSDELKRVMIHGILHLCGYGDKTESEDALMRQKEDEKIGLFHVEQ
ncbi:rRNA maturation RNase YbeY [Salegentibacter mishustinae]|uniref:Endoribonuclease YbeY n=1 Tax=Salegentibacter mishustinae TaxID=270918 RepID=A0A0Q9ZAV8_9FLAO|nr:rRNA maturation RNase YbeY [Salegentibacter mishustinae]KRG30043.1 rRNA maturation factor [Salegentibacter mishustinae]PNW22673.1 rRNA maturation factor [Salegentibacter mishustinae]